MPVVLCSTSSFEGQYLSGYAPYSGVENHFFISLETYDIHCGDPAPGYSLVGDVPPGLVCETPGSTSTKLVSSALGALFRTDVLKDFIDEWDAKHSMTLSIPGSDQGQISMTPTQVSTPVFRTFNFTLKYDGVSSGSPCSSTLPLTMGVLIDWPSHSGLAEQTIQELIDNPRDDDFVP